MPLSSLARRTQNSNVELHSSSHQIQSVVQQSSSSASPIRVRKDNTAQTPLALPPKPSLSSLTQKAAGRNSSQSSASTVPKTSKLAQKIKLTQSASQKKVAPPTVDDSIKMPHSPLSLETPLVGSAGSATHILFPSINLSPVSIPSSSRRLHVSPATPIVASASTFASILVSTNKSPLPSAPRVGKKGFGPVRDNGILFTFNTPSPDDIVLAKRAGTRLAKERASGALQI